MFRLVVLPCFDLGLAVSIRKKLLARLIQQHTIRCALHGTGFAELAERVIF